jgi:uncharacterized membrane protein YfcA
MLGALRLGERGMRPWLLWLLGVYSIWVAINVIGDYWADTLAHWPIAVVMVLGSYIAGSTPMGGGTVAFPVLVLLFELPATLGRNFGLCVQATGMTSAAIFILCRRSPIETRLLRWSVLGSALGLSFGTFVIAPLVPETYVKLLFACLWVSFGVLTLIKNRELCALDGIPVIPPRVARSVGLTVGIAGGVTTSLIGVGMDMMLYTVLVLLFRMDLKVAVPTAVIGMAAASVLGAALHVAIGDVGDEVFFSWLAATPIVILGAPIGAFLVSVIAREKTLYVVAVLCLLQFAWTVSAVRPSGGEWLFTGASLSLAAIGFVVLYRLGFARVMNARAAA